MTDEDEEDHIDYCYYCEEDLYQSTVPYEESGSSRSFLIAGGSNGDNDDSEDK